MPANMRSLSAELGISIMIVCFASTANSQHQATDQAVPPPPSSTSAKSRLGLAPPVTQQQQPAGVAWGPGTQVQAGLVLSGRYGSPGQPTGMYVFDLYIRNITKQSITVDCPSYGGLSVPRDDSAYTTLMQSFGLFCSPSIKDAGGMPVNVRFRQGTTHARIAVGPGECVMVSHWMLRTLKRAAKTPETSKYTQVVFVEPGNYTVSCTLRASWESSKRRREMISTGDLAFIVTHEDLAL